MGHRLTADMSKAGKVKRAGGQSARQRVAMHVHHVCRSADINEETGMPRQRSFRNKDIDPSRTHRNEVWINDFDGGFENVESLDEVMDIVDRYMGQLDPEVTVRKDAIHVRGVVLNLDEEWWAQNNPDWRTEGLNDEGRQMMDALLDSFLDEVGQKHVAWAALHMDEGIPQWQVGIIPIVEGRLSSDKVLPSGSKAMKDFHQRMRQRMTTAGYDIEMQSSERSTERLSMPTFKKAQRWMDEQEAATGVRPELPSPTMLLDQAVIAAMSSPHVFDEASFDEALAEYDVTRDVNPETGGTVYSMPNPFYDPNDEEDRHHTPRVRRAASKLPSKPTAKVVAQALAQKQASHGQRTQQAHPSSHIKFSSVEHLDDGGFDLSTVADGHADRELDEAAERDRIDGEVDAAGVDLDDLSAKLDEAQRRREVQRRRRASEAARREAERVAEQADRNSEQQRSASTSFGGDDHGAGREEPDDDAPDY